MATDLTHVGAERILRRRRESHVKEYVEAILIAVVIAVILRLFVVQAYRVSSGSMEDTLIEGDFLFVNKMAYVFGEPKVDDVIVFEFPMNPTKDYIKRIVALPGQVVEIREKRLYVDNELVPDEPGMQVPADNYFVLGDNRDDSQDSRFWGFLDKKHIKGKALFVYFSWAPDPKAPKIESPYVFDFFLSAFYNATHFFTRLRADRMFSGV
jgi:signal peptidase I